MSTPARKHLPHHWTSPHPSTPPRRKRLRPLNTTPELCRATKAELSDPGDPSPTDSEDYEADVAYTRSTGAPAPQYRNTYKIKMFLETLVTVMSKPGRSPQPHDDEAKEIMRDFLKDSLFYHLLALRDAEGPDQSSAKERFREES
ncbi:hypothetical protein BDZ89DRAFT_1060570 [Hymenopellis radicata]|nr:hypothetical protein BDZ89DRAFT_1060570 [Hymenopellis radicata]